MNETERRAILELVKELRGQLNGTSLRVTVVVSRWNELVTKELLAGALDELARMAVAEPEVVSVPGTWEIPVAVTALLNREANRPDAIVALGCIMQGETAHAALLGGDVSGSLMGLQTSSGVPIAWGILTPSTLEQALDRAGVKQGNKGREAAQAAVEMANLLKTI